MMDVSVDAANRYVHPHWMISNTTVRNPKRLQPVVERLAETSFIISTGPEAERRFASWLDENNIVSLMDTTEDVSSLGRKWRGALEKMGLIFPGDHPQEYQLSPIGRRLADSSDGVMVEQLLKFAVASYRCRLPFLENESIIHPLSWTLEVLKSLDAEPSNASAAYEGLSMEEFALFIQAPNPQLEPDLAAEYIRQFRTDKSGFLGDKRVFAREWYEANVIQDQRQGLKGGVAYRSAVLDYADLNTRYLMLSGVLDIKGLRSRRRAGIKIRRGSRNAVEAILEEFPIGVDGAGYFQNHWTRSDIVIGSLDALKREYRETICRAMSRELAVDSAGADLATREGVQSSITRLSRDIRIRDENEFARAQRDKTDEILVGFSELERTRRRAGGVFEVVDPDLKPTYLEWLLWRAGLALSKGRVDSTSARGFKLDSDLNPIGFAPPGRADVVFEFDEFVLVFEATLMAGSRQEAAEGEPVRRHVADLVDRFSKPVVCLFVASRIDLNTIETFRIGSWYNPDEDLRKLDILPLTIRQFSSWFRNAVSRSSDQREFLKLVQDGRGLSSVSLDAKSWRSELSEMFE